MIASRSCSHQHLPTTYFSFPFCYCYSATAAMADEHVFLSPALGFLPRPLKDDPTGSPSHTNSDHNHYLSRADLYQGPIDVAPTDMPGLYDILLSDIDEKLLHNEISTALGSAYLSETPHLINPLATVDGIMFGKHDRVLFPLVVRFPRKSHSYVMHFLYDSGSPHTFLSQEVCGVPKYFTYSH